MQNRFRRAFNCVRERTCVSYAKIASMGGGICDVDLIITKATSHDDFPLPDRYVHHLLKIFSISPATCSAFALAFARRFRSTQSWRVALKCLLLLHRLLRSAPGLRADLLWARTNGMLSLYPCTFRDRTSSASHHYTTFIASYARLLDEALDCVVVEGNTVDDDDDEDAPRKSQELERMIQVLPQLQSLIDRAIECWPIGAASRSFLVHSAMKHVIRDSNWRYAAFRREIVVVLENLIQMPYRSCAAAFRIYKKAAAQADRLAGFHEWCKNMGYCGSYEYPYIDRIPDIQIRALETFLNGMWQRTDQSSITTVSGEQSPVSSNDNNDGSGGEKSPVSSNDNGDGSGGERPNDVIEDLRDMEVEPLIKWEVEESSGGWEDLLEASIHSKESRNGWQIEVYNPYGFQTPNPFYEQPNHRTYNLNYGSCPNTPLQHPWLGVRVNDAATRA